MNKVHPFAALTTPLPFTLLSNLCIADEDALVANLEKKYFSKGTVMSVSGFLPKLLVILPNVLPRNPTD